MCTAYMTMTRPPSSSTPTARDSVPEPMVFASDLVDSREASPETVPRGLPAAPVAAVMLPAAAGAFTASSPGPASPVPGEWRLRCSHIRVAAAQSSATRPPTTGPPIGSCTDHGEGSRRCTRWGARRSPAGCARGAASRPAPQPWPCLPVPPRLQGTRNYARVRRLEPASLG